MQVHRVLTAVKIFISPETLPASAAVAMARVTTETRPRKEIADESMSPLVTDNFTDVEI